MDGLPPSSTPNVEVARGPAAVHVGTSFDPLAPPTTPEEQTDQFISVLKALVNDPSEGKSLQLQSQFGMLLLKKMTQIIQLEEQNRIRTDQLETLQEMARAFFVPRLVQAAAQARQQQQGKQQAAAARNQTLTSAGSGVRMPHFDGSKWEALDTAIIFAPPSNHGCSIPPPYTQNQPSSFNLQPPARMSEKLSDEVVNWKRIVEGREGRMVVDPFRWRNGRRGAPRPTLNLGLADGMGGSLLGCDWAIHGLEQHNEEFQRSESLGIAEDMLTEPSVLRPEQESSSLPGSIGTSPLLGRNPPNMDTSDGLQTSPDDERVGPDTLAALLPAAHRQGEIYNLALDVSLSTARRMMEDQDVKWTPEVAERAKRYTEVFIRTKLDEEERTIDEDMGRA